MGAALTIAFADPRLKDIGSIYNETQNTLRLRAKTWRKLSDMP